MTQPPTQPPPGPSQPPAPTTPGGPPAAPGYQGGPPTAGPGRGGVLGGPKANFAQRLVAFLIDQAILWVVYLVLSILLGGVMSFGNDSAFIGGIGFLGVLVFLVVGVGYYIYFEGSESGQTVGKKAMSIRVVDLATGGPLGYGKAGLRYVGKIISGIPCYLGYLWMLWDQDQQTWHDKIATTTVVPTTAYPVSKWP
jgi:uncharacterized RDD family membrane protein YckC